MSLGSKSALYKTLQIGDLLVFRIESSAPYLAVRLW